MDTSVTMPHLSTASDPRQAGLPVHPDRAPGPATRYIGGMKSASLPAVPVEPALRAELEAALEEGESMDEFIEGAVAERVRRRQAARAEFLARGRASLEEARRTGTFIPAEEVLRGLEDKLEAAKRRMASRVK
jgi:hypothetical protein